MIEVLVFAIAVSLLAILALWRARRVGSAEDPGRRAVQDVPAAQRSMSAFPDDQVVLGVPQQRPVSRESGHGKDGG